MLLINVWVCVCVHVLNFCFAYLSLRRRTIFYIGTLLILIACVCVCVHACVRVHSCKCMCVCVQVYVWAFGCCFVGANGCIPLTMLVDVCQCCCLLMFVCLPLLRHFPCKTWWIKNLNLNLWNVGQNDSCTPACLQTGSVWPKPNTVSLNQTRSGLVLHSMMCAVCTRTQPRAGLMTPAHQLTSGPDLFGPNLTRSSRLDPGQFCTIWSGPFLEEWNWIGSGKLDPAYLIQPNSGSTLAAVALPGRNQNT